MTIPAGKCLNMSMLFWRVKEFFTQPLFQVFLWQLALLEENISFTITDTDRKGMYRIIECIFSVVFVCSWMRQKLV